MSQLGPCPPPETLARYLADGPSSDSFAEMERHISACAACQDRLRAEIRAAQGDFPERPLASSAVIAPPLIPGFEVLGELGRGGLGIVYRARQLSVGREVALKVLLAGRHASESDCKRLLREAHTLGRLNHPHLVRVFDAGTHDNLVFLVLELVEGANLRTRLGGTPMPPLEAAQLVQAVAWAVQTAHEQGVVHFDLKPANVLLADAANGADAARPKVADFGLARRLHSDGSASSGTHLVGTPSYMAPEQIGSGAEAVSPTVDVYGLGAILYETLTGRPPFRGDSPLETLDQVRTHDPVAPSRLQPRCPRDLETICLKCLRKHPKERYASAQELADDLGRFLDGKPIRARPVSVGKRLRLWVGRNPVVAALGALLLVSLLAGLGFGSWQWWEAALARDEAVANEKQARDLLREREAAQALNEAQHHKTRELLAEFKSIGTAKVDTFQLRERRNAILRLTVSHFRDLVRSRPDDTELHDKFGQLLLEFSGCSWSVGETAVCTPSLREARDVYAGVHRRLPNDPVIALQYYRASSQLFDHTQGKEGEIAVALLAVNLPAAWELALDGSAPEYWRQVVPLGRELQYHLTAQGRFDDAHKVAGNEKQNVTALIQKFPSEKWLRWSLLGTYRLDALCWEKEGKPEAAAQAWKNVMKMATPLLFEPLDLDEIMLHVGPQLGEFLSHSQTAELRQQVFILSERLLLEAERDWRTGTKDCYYLSSGFAVASELVRLHRLAGRLERIPPLLTWYERMGTHLQPESVPEELRLRIARSASVSVHLGQQSGQEKQALPRARLAWRFYTHTDRAKKIAEGAGLFQEYRDLASFFGRAGATSEARAVWEELADLAETALPRQPDAMFAIAALLDGYEQNGKPHLAKSKDQQTVAAWERKFELIGDTLTRQPQNAADRAQSDNRLMVIATVAITRAIENQQSGQEKQVLPLARLAWRLLARLSREQKIARGAELFPSYPLLATVFRRAGAFSETRAVIAELAALAEAVLRQQPDARFAIVALFEAHEQTGKLLIEEDKIGEAAAPWLRSEAMLRQVLARHPQDADYRTRLARRRIGLAKHYLSRHLHAEAYVWFLRAEELRPESAELRGLLAQLRGQLGVAKQ